MKLFAEVEQLQQGLQPTPADETAPGEGNSKDYRLSVEVPAVPSVLSVPPILQDPDCFWSARLRSLLWEPLWFPSPSLMEDTGTLVGTFCIRMPSSGPFGWN